MNEVPFFLPPHKALQVLTKEEQEKFISIVSSIKLGDRPTIPEDIAKKLKVETARLNKDKKISFRVTTEIHEKLEAIATANDLSMSRLMESITKEYLQIFDNEYALAGFLNTFAEEKEFKQLFTKLESIMPEQFRLYTKVMKKYPNAPPIKGLIEITEDMKKAMDEQNAGGNGVVAE